MHVVVASLGGGDEERTHRALWTLWMFIYLFLD